MDSELDPKRANEDADAADTNEEAITGRSDDAEEFDDADDADADDMEDVDAEDAEE